MITSPTPETALQAVVSTYHYVDWTKVKTFDELLVALNALEITVANDCKAYELLKPYLRD